MAERKMERKQNSKMQAGLCSLNTTGSLPVLLDIELLSDRGLTRSPNWCLEANEFTEHLSNTHVNDFKH
jgi:hypothetical protein